MTELDMLADIYGEDAVAPIVNDMKAGRDMGLECAIKTCREIASKDGSAAQCVKVLERIQFKLAHGRDAKPQ